MKLEPEEIWVGEDSQFKFSTDIFPTQALRTYNTVSGANPQVQKVIAINNLEEKVNITSDIAGLDDIIQKQLKGDAGNTINSLQSFDIQKPFQPGELISADIIGSNTIEAVQEVGSSILDDGAFYKISVDMGIRTDIIGNSNNNTITSVISKFYSQNSYTSSYSEGSIPYQHNSTEPIYINDIRVRILDPNNKISTSVGNKNTVFLEVIKNK